MAGPAVTEGRTEPGGVGGHHRSASRCGLVRTGEVRNCTDGERAVRPWTPGVPVALSDQWSVETQDCSANQRGEWTDYRAHNEITVERMDLTVQAPFGCVPQNVLGKESSMHEPLNEVYL